MEKFVYDFAEGNKDLKDLLGGKGANLAEMTNLGLPVPPGFTITTEACRGTCAPADCPTGSTGEVDEHLAALEAQMGRRLGDPADPLLVSVRSGAKFSMPGMMETVLNVGLTDRSVAGPRRAGRRRRAVRLGLLPAADPDVRQDRVRRARRGVRARAGRGEARPRAPPTTWTSTPPTCGRWSTRTRRSSPSTPAATSRRTRASSSTSPSRAVFELLERRPGRAVPPAGAHPDRPRHRGQRGRDGLRQPRRRLRHRRGVHPRPGHRRAAASTATTWPTPRARTWSPASATPCRCRSWSSIDTAQLRRADGASWPRSRSTTGTCATSSSPSSAASCGCCRPGSASAPRRPRSSSPRSSSTRASSTSTRRCAGSPARSWPS